MSMPASSSQTMYGFFIDPSEVHLFTQDVIWEKKIRLFIVDSY